MVVGERRGGPPGEGAQARRIARRPPQLLRADAGGIAGDHAGAAADAGQSDGDGGTLGDAKRFLTSLLEDGPMPVKEIQANARGAGYSEATIRRAKDALKVEAIKIGKDRWEWQLPISAPPLGTQVKVLNKTEDAHQKSVSTFDNFEHLQIPTAGYSIEI
jgi:hypothetical protein